MLEQAINQAMNQFALGMAQEVARDPAGTLKAIGSIFDCHHTAEDVGQDALDAYEAGNLSHKAAMAIVQIVVADVQERRGVPTQQPQRSPAYRPSPAPAQTSLAKPAPVMEMRKMLRQIQ